MQTNRLRTICRVRLAVVGLLFAAAPSGAQDFKATLEKMRESYAQSQQFRIEMRIQAFETEKAPSAFYDQRVLIFRNQDNYLYQLEDQDMLINEGHFLMVNKATREIIRRPRGKEDQQSLRGQALPNLDSLLNLRGAPEYRGEKDQLQQYRFREKKGEIELTDLYFSVVTGLVREITYRYRSGQRARIQFTLFDLHPRFDPDTFDEKRYIAVAAKGKYRGTGSFSSYLVHE